MAYWQKRWRENPKEFEDLALAIMKDESLRALIVQLVDGRPKQNLNVEGEIRHPIYLPSELMEKNDIPRITESNSEGQTPV